jgi:L-iditol 2-dehydrogenase
VVLRGVDDLVLMDTPLPSVGPLDVLVRVQAVGICGSDVHYWKHGCCGHYVLEKPMVIGHESAGEVVKVGCNVTHLKEGDLVAMEPGVACDRCRYCQSGRYNLCENMQFFATPPFNGSLATYISHPAKYCFLIPDNLNVEHGALCEPLSVAIHACNRALVNDKSTVLILGCGPIGLMMLAAAHAYGAKKLVVADFNLGRLEFAEGLVPCETIHLKGLSPEDVALKSMRLTGEQCSVVFDCAGFESSMQTALLATQPGGKVVLIGCGQNEVKIPLCSAAQREIDIMGIFRFRNTYPTALELMSSGKIKIDSMITHRFGLTQEEVVKGFRIAQTGEGNAIKVMFRY